MIKVLARCRLRQICMKLLRAINANIKATPPNPWFSFDSCGVETRIFYDIWINATARDALAPCIARPSAAVAFIMQCKRDFDLHFNYLRSVIEEMQTTRAQSLRKCKCLLIIPKTLQWRLNEHDGVSNHQRFDCLLYPLFRRRSKKISKFRVTGPCEGNSPVTGEFPTQRASNAEHVSILWRHHDNSAWQGLSDSLPGLHDIKVWPADELRELISLGGSLAASQH